MDSSQAPDLQDLASFRRSGDASHLERLLAHHGPALAAWLEGHGMGEADFARVFAELAVGRLPLAKRSVRAALFAAAVREPAAEGLTGDAWWLATRGGLGVEDASVVLRVDEAEAGRMVVDAGLARCALPEQPPTAFHLGDRQLARVGFGVARGAELASDTGHLSWCELCRSRAAILVGETALAPLPALDPAWEAAALSAAVVLRQQLRVAPRVMRFWGLKPGAPWRPARLLAVASVLGLVVWAGVTAQQLAVAEDAYVDAALHIDAPASLVAGSRAVFRVSASERDRDGRRVAGIKGQSVQLDLLGKDGKASASAEGTTDETGAALLTLVVPRDLPPNRSILVVARALVGDRLREARAGVYAERHFQQHLSVDKPTYQPGQTIHLRGMSFDGGSHTPLTGAPATLEVRDPRGRRLSRVQTEVSTYGVCAADVELSGRAAMGSYTARLTVAGHTSTTTFKVEQYTLPPFTVKVAPAIRATEGHQPFEVKIRVRHTTGAPLAQGTVRIRALAAGRQLFMRAAKVVQGEASFTIPLSKKTDMGYAGSIQLVASVRDVAGRAEKGRASVLVARDVLEVSLRSAAASLRRNLPRANQVLVRVVRPGDQPAAVPVSLYATDEGAAGAVMGSGELLGEGKSGEDGLATLDLPPAYFGRPLAVLATDPRNGKKSWSRFSPPPVRSGSLVLGCDRALMRAGSKLTCEVFSPRAESVEITAAADGRVVALATTPATKGIHEVALALAPDAQGLVRVGAKGSDRRDAVHVIVSPKDGLKVELAAAKTMMPGQETQLRIKLSDGQGKPRVGAVGLSVVDAAVFARASGETPMQVIHKLLQQGASAEVAALMFPEVPIGTPGAIGRWTAVQQAAARWTLATRVSDAPTLAGGSSIEKDQRARDRVEIEAYRTAKKSRQVAAVALFALLVAALLLWSAWLRLGVGAVAIGASAMVLLVLVFEELLGLRTSRGPLHGFIWVAGIAGFAWVMWQGVYERRRHGRGLPERKTWPWLRRAMVVAVVGLVGFVGVQGGLGDLLDGGGGERHAPRAVVEERTNETYEVHVEDEDTPSAAKAAPQPTGRGRGLEREELVRKARKVVAKKTIAGAFMKGGAATKLFAEGGDGDEPTQGIGGGAATGETSALRQDFPETLYHNPAVVTGPDGEAEVSLRVADSITTWRAFALASDASGALGAGRRDIVVDKPFTVDLDVPRNLTVGDDVAVQVAAHNRTEAGGALSLRAKVGPGLSVDSGPLTRLTRLGAGRDAGALVPVKAIAAGEQPVRIDGLLSKAKDAIQRSITVTPDGREVRRTVAGLITDRVERQVDLSAVALPDARRVTLTLMGSPLSAALDGLAALSEMPSGCFEQTASRVYVDALVLRALGASARLSEARKASLKRMLRIGYQDMLGFQRDDGQLSYFGDDGRIHLSAWGLLVFGELARHVYVDPDVLTDIERALIDRVDRFGGFGGPSQSAYVALAMLEHHPTCALEEDKQGGAHAKAKAPGARRVSPRLRRTCRRLLRSMKTTFAVTKGVDSYALALAADAFVRAGPAYRSTAEALLDELDSRATVVGKGKRRRVTFQSRSSTLCGGYGRPAEVETTALVAHALIRHGDRAAKAREALRSLLVLRDGAGGFYSTQATALAVRAILAAAEEQGAGGSVVVKLDGQEVARADFDPKRPDQPVSVDLSDKVKPGARVQIALAGRDSASADVAYRLSSRYFEPWDSPPGGAVTGAGQDLPTLALRHSLPKKRYGLGDKTTLDVRLDRSLTGRPRGMILLQVGVPPGFRVDDVSRVRRSSHQIKRVEPYARGLSLYLYDLRPGQQLHVQVPLIAARAVKRVAVPRSRAVYTYEPHIEAQAKPFTVNVIPRLGRDG